MKRILLLMLPLLLVLSFAGCSNKPPVSRTDTGLPSLTLVSELANEHMELSSLPWFSPVEDAITFFDLKPNEYVVQHIRWSEPREDLEGRARNDYGLQIMLPVYISDLDTDMLLTLGYRLNYSYLDKPKETVLTTVMLKVFFEERLDEGEFREKLVTLFDTLAAEFPDIYEGMFQVFGEDRAHPESYMIMKQILSLPDALRDVEGSFYNGFSVDMTSSMRTGAGLGYSHARVIHFGVTADEEASYFMDNDNRPVISRD